MLYSISMRNSGFLLILTVFFSGCLAGAPEELDRLIKEDPQFRQMITARDQAHQQIRAIKNDLLQRKKTMDAQISKLREDYDTYAKAQNTKIEQYQSTIAANKNLLRREIDTSAAQLEAKTTELDGYEKTLADVKKVLQESKGLRLSKDEKEKWEERMLMLSEKVRPLTEEIQELKLQIRLKKQKISFLK